MPMAMTEIVTESSHAQCELCKILKTVRDALSRVSRRDRKKQSGVPLRSRFGPLQSPPVQSNPAGNTLLWNLVHVFRPALKRCSDTSFTSSLNFCLGGVSTYLSFTASRILFALSSSHHYSTSLSAMAQTCCPLNLIKRDNCLTVKNNHLFVRKIFLPHIPFWCHFSLRTLIAHLRFASL